MSRRSPLAPTGAPDDLVGRILADAPLLNDQGAEEVLTTLGIAVTADAIVDLVELVDVYSFNRAVELATPSAAEYRDYFEAVRFGTERLLLCAVASRQKGLPLAVKTDGWARIETLVLKTFPQMKRRDIVALLKSIRTASLELKKHTQRSIQLQSRDLNPFERLVGSAFSFCKNYAGADETRQSIVTHLIWALYSSINPEHSKADLGGYFRESFGEIDSVAKAVVRASKRLAFRPDLPFRRPFQRGFWGPKPMSGFGAPQKQTICASNLFERQNGRGRGPRTLYG